MSSVTPTRTGFFHTLVVFGAGVTLAGCGARVVGDEGGEQSGPHGGGVSPEGGASTASAGGKAGAGGAPGAAGTPAAGGSPGASTMAPSPTAQWSCNGSWVGCTSLMTATGSESIFKLDAPCPVDPAKPRSVADCAPNEQFECARAMLGDTVLAVDCLCSPAAPDGSCGYCSVRGGAGVSTGDTGCVGRTKLCGCITGILR